MRESLPPDGSEVEYYRRLVEGFPNGVLVLFDDDLRYCLVGPERLPFSGIDSESMVGKTIFELFPEPTATELEPELRATLDGSSRSFDMRYGGRVHHIETTPTEIDGEAYGVLVTQNVTAERETTEELEAKTRQLETVANVLAHDLRNPLTIALGNLETLEDEVGDSEALERIQGALDRMDTIMSDALTLARETQLSTEELVDIQDHVESTWELVPTASATLEIDGSLVVEADPGLLTNLFENLISNAVSHGGEDVTIRVGVLEEGDGFYVEDDGPGFDQSSGEDMFEPGMTTGTTDGHTGLGLAIVRSIAEAHGWTVGVADAASGGARFEIGGIDPVE